MYHYTECGLDNVYLEDGYQKIDTDSSTAVSIVDLEGLHELIALSLVEGKPKLTGKEFRFLRKEMDLSQNKLAGLLGANEQSVSLWERTGKVPKWADYMTRTLYKQYIGGEGDIRRLVEKINTLERMMNDKFYFKLTSQNNEEEWEKAA